MHLPELKRGLALDRYVAPAQGMLGADHLWPVLAFMLFLDLLQRFWITPVPAFDRARALEASWEASAHRFLGGEGFSGAFLQLWNNQPRVLPALLLSSLRVETGQRGIIGNLPLTADFEDAVELLHPGPVSRHQSLDGITVVAAVHLSARQAYVSPAARDLPRLERDR